MIGVNKEGTGRRAFAGKSRAAMGRMVLESLAQALAGERPAHSLTT